MKKWLLILALSGAAPLALAQEPAPAEAPGVLNRNVFQAFERNIGAFSLVDASPRASFHKPMYLIPLTWSEQYPEEETEVLFQISLKQQLFKRRLYFGYTQKSFWQLYNGAQSRPFRETNYNPELFLRFRQLGGTPWGVDVGGDHESNGKSLPDSRSWNRLFAAGYYETAHSLAHLKVWWRLPEKDRTSPTDPRGDDNPDLETYYGYGELTLQRKLFGDAHRATLMLRANPASGKGAVNLFYSAPFGDYAYWNLYAWHGYGESLLDYNNRVTRVGVGVMLAR